MFSLSKFCKIFRTIVSTGYNIVTDFRQRGRAICLSYTAKFNNSILYRMVNIKVHLSLQNFEILNEAMRSIENSEEVSPSSPTIIIVKRRNMQPVHACNSTLSDLTTCA